MRARVGVQQWVPTLAGEYDGGGDTNNHGEKKGKFLFLQKNIYILSDLGKEWLCDIILNYGGGN